MIKINLQQKIKMVIKVHQIYHYNLNRQNIQVF
jgi:hypothetical protein